MSVYGSATPARASLRAIADRRRRRRERPAPGRARCAARRSRRCRAAAGRRVPSRARRSRSAGRRARRRRGRSPRPQARRAPRSRRRGPRLSARSFTSASTLPTRSSSACVQVRDDLGDSRSSRRRAGRRGERPRRRRAARRTPARGRSPRSVAASADGEPSVASRIGFMMPPSEDALNVPRVSAARAVRESGRGAGRGAGSFPQRGCDPTPIPPRSCACTIRVWHVPVHASQPDPRSKTSSFATARRCASARPTARRRGRSDRLLPVALARQSVPALPRRDDDRSPDGRRRARDRLDDPRLAPR